jgi:hypothetical protein
VSQGTLSDARRAAADRMSDLRAATAALLG